MNNFSDSQASDLFSASVPDTITIPLLAEGLLVKREKKKVGTVLIKKEIRTRIVEVPIRQEVIVVEQVASPPIQLAAIDLTDYQNPEYNPEYNPDNRDNCILKTHSDNYNIPEYVVECKFFPVKIAAEILQQIATQIDNEYVQVSLEILVSNSQQQVQIQEIINQLSEPRISS